LETFEWMMKCLSDAQSLTPIEVKLENLAHFLGNILENSRQDVLRILVENVAEHPAYVSAYATLVGLLNMSNFQFGAECVHFMMQNLCGALNDQNWSRSKCLVSFFVELFNCNVITCQSLVNLLSTFLIECEEHIGDTLPQSRRDWIAYCVLSSLPSVGKELERKSFNNFRGLLLTLQIYVKKRIPLHAVLLGVWHGGGGCAQIDYLELLWQQVDRMRELQWLEPDYQLIMRPNLAFDGTLSAALQHVLPPFEMPPHQQDLEYPHPRVVFRIFDFAASQDGQHMPPAQSIERYLLERQILEILEVYHLERRLCTDNLCSYAQIRPQVAVSYCIVEVILGEMLQLPNSRWMTINYSALLVELSKRLPDKIPMAIMQAADIIFAQLDTMSVACFDRLINFVSHYLSNFSFHWHWTEWIGICTKAGSKNGVPLKISPSDLQPKAVFLRELVKKCIRLSYYQNIVEVLPDNVGPFLPPPPHAQFKFIDEKIAGSKLAQSLLEAMRVKKPDPATITAFLRLCNDPELLKVNLFTQAILHIGCKSFSHTFAALARYYDVLKGMANGEKAQHAILNGIFELWMCNEQFKLVVVQKMLRMQIVEPKYVVSWIFAPGLWAELSKTYIWEILHATIRLIKNPSRFVPRKSAPDGDKILNQEPMELRFILLDVTHRFIKVLTGSLNQMDETNNKYWRQWVLGRFQEFLFIYLEDFKTLGHKLIKISEDEDLGKDIVKTIQSFLAYAM
ncbi:hypothetical protein KR018_005655, partial [Drosophila ironensis]